MITRLIINASTPAKRKKLLSAFHKFEADNQGMINQYGKLQDGVFEVTDPAEAHIEIQGAVAAIWEIEYEEEE